MIFEFTYAGNTPSKKDQQQIFKSKTGRPFITTSARHKAWHKEAAWALRQQLAKLPSRLFPIQKAKKVALQIYYDTWRRRDNSNVWESVADLLVDVGILADDRWDVTGPTFQFPVYRKGAPGWLCAIEVEDLAAAAVREPGTVIQPAAPAEAFL